MSAATTTDLTTIEHLDFDPTIPCEANVKSGCDTPADVLIVGQCPGCGVGGSRRYGICWPHWHQGRGKHLHCEACGHRAPMCGGFFRIVEVL